MARESGESALGVSPVQRILEQRLANPVLARLLRSPLHWPLSRWLVLVSYVGRRSERRVAFPALYARVDGALVVATPGRESRWWRHFRSARPCTLWLRGRRRAATGTVVGGDEVDPMLAGYLERYGWLWRRLADQGEAGIRNELVVVRFDPDGDG